jgi:glycosyltransferase involved in cell wall biosynthesis
MKKIVIVHDKIININSGDVFIGGIQTYLFNLAELLIANNYQVEFIQLGNCECKGVIKGILVQQFNYKSIKKLPISQLVSPKSILIWGTDLNSFKVPMKSISIQHGIGFDYVFMESPFKKALVNFGLSFLYKFLQRRKALKAFSKADLRVCVDYNFQNWYRTFSNRADDKTIKVIPNFSRLPSQYIKREKYTKILFARRLIEKRGVKIFCSSIAKLLTQYDNIEVSIAGDGPLLKYVEEKFKQTVNVKIFQYEQSQSLEIHKAHDIAVIPTLGGEGTSLSLLEAMASGCAVIATDVGGITNILLDNYNGLLISPDEGELTVKLSLLLDRHELCESLSIKAFDTVSRSFSKEKWGNKWLSVLESKELNNNE